MGYEEERDRSGHRRSRRAKPSEMEDDGLTLITDSFTERREDGSHRSGDRSRSGQKAAKRGQTQPGSSRESRNQEKTRTMNRSDIYADPVKLKARRKKKRKIWFILLESVMLIGILCFAGYSYISSRLDLMQRLPWNPDEIKNVEISEEKQEQMSGYWTIAVFGVDSRNSSVGKGNNSDVNILCNIDQGTGEIRLVSVYRDSYLNISDKNTYNKINAAYMQGGPEQVVKALNRNLDIDIDDYATFNWKAVADAINILGGIDVEITKSEFYYINAFISETVKATGVASTQLKSIEDSFGKLNDEIETPPQEISLRGRLFVCLAAHVYLFLCGVRRTIICNFLIRHRSLAVAAVWFLFGVLLWSIRLFVSGSRRGFFGRTGAGGIAAIIAGRIFG